MPNGLAIFGDEKSTRKKVMSLVTDSTPVEAPKPTENSSLLALYQLVASPDDYVRMLGEFKAGGVGYGDFKKRLFESIWESFASMRKRRAELEREPSYVEFVLRKGADKARRVADGVLSRVREAVGLR